MSIKGFFKAGKDGLRKFWNWLTGGTPEAGAKTADAALQTAKDLQLVSCATVISESRHIAPYVFPQPTLEYFGVHIKAVCAKVGVVAAKYKFTQIALGLAKVAGISTLAVGIVGGAMLIAGGMVLCGIILNRLCKNLPGHLRELRNEIQRLKDLLAGLGGGGNATA
jgi:hypothetical protein